MSNAIVSAYCDGRGRLMRQARQLIGDVKAADRIVSAVFWEDCFKDGEGNLGSFTGRDWARASRVQAVSFDPPTLTFPVEKAGGYLQLQITTHWVLDLRPYDHAEAFFRALSPKNRKKLRWLGNAVPKTGAKICPFSDEADFDAFEQLYVRQFPKYPPGSEINRGVRRIYRHLFDSGCGCGWLMRDELGEPVAAALGYRLGRGFNFTHLTRAAGKLDKFSPGFFLTYQIMLELLSENERPDFFFMGPGKYDYKAAFLGQPMAIYRLERNSLSNLFGLIRMYHRAARERRRATVK